MEAIAPGREIPSPVREAKEEKRPKTAKSGGGPGPRRPKIGTGAMLPNCLGAICHGS